MKKNIPFVIFFLLASFVALAQDNFSFSPQQPRPGDQVKISYTPPSTIFNEADLINCVVYKWGVWCDPFPRTTGERNYKPIEILLKKSGNRYEGSVPTDSLTRMLAFSFTSGDVKWKDLKSQTVLTTGKIDNNLNSGYCIPFYTMQGNPCRYSHFFIGQYLSDKFYNDLGIKNPEKASEHFLGEQELFADAKYYTLPWLVSSYPADSFKLLATKEMEKLFAGGFQTEKDLRLASNLSWQLKLTNQSGYFSGLSRQKFKDTGGAVMASIKWSEFNMEKDAAKKIDILNGIARLYNNAGFETRMGFPPFVYSYWNFLFALANEGKTDELKAWLEKFDYLKDDILSGTYKDYFPRIEDTLIAQWKDPALAEKLALERFAYPTRLLEDIKKGNSLPMLNGSEYYTRKEKINAITAAAAIAADKAAQFYVQKGDEKTAWKYAQEAKQYLQKTTIAYRDAHSLNNRYSLLAEKFLPAKECRTEVEKLVLSGAWKSDMLDVLKRIWIKEKKSEDGFEAYIKSLRKDVLEDAKKTLLAAQLSEVAPAFALNDMEGKEVSLQSLKGKTVVLDFWATWCTPCKASFPGMQKLVTAYKNNPDVQFLFIDTWENGKFTGTLADPQKIKAVADYISGKKYSFRVLLDNQSKTVADYKIEGIPTKIIIDKNGQMRYKVVGYEANEGKLFDEMNAMIESVK